jgi:hypothetical protein
LNGVELRDVVGQGCSGYRAH